MDHDLMTDRRQARRDALALLATGPIVTAILLTVWAVTGGGYFWPMWPTLGMSIALLVALWRAFGHLLRRKPGTDAGPQHLA
jgi:hypothetical protein